tara:strand:- start:5618 stop:6271 length:654 start_codon:yes stop_codon:yes gene_type:complete
MVTNPLHDVLKDIPSRKFKSQEVILPVTLFENKKANPEVLFPKFDVLSGAVGIFAEYMIEILVPEVEQYLKKNDFPDLLYENYLYEVKAIRDLEQGETIDNYAGGRVLNYSKIEEITSKLDKNLKGVFLMVCYYTMEKLPKPDSLKCRMVINRIEFYDLKVKEIDTLNEGVMGKTTFHVYQFRDEFDVQGSRLSQVKKDYLTSVNKTKQEIKKHGGN